METMKNIYRANSNKEKRGLIFLLQRDHGIDFGVCKHYLIESDKQFCLLTPEKFECNRVIPQKYCVPRDRHKDPRQELERPELQDRHRTGSFFVIF